MSEEPTAGGATKKEARRDAKANAAAEKARAKAQRSWYQKKRFIIPLVLVALVIIGGVISSGAETDDAQVAEDAEPAPNNEGGGDAAAEEPAQEDVPEEVPEDAERAGIGEAAPDGQFTFTVNGLECGLDTIGEDFLEEEAQGQFCVLDLTVENTGDEARALDASSQYLYDDQDRQFSSSFTLAAAVESPLFEQINPGNSLDGRIPFDVPEDASIQIAELHDSALSDGVVVDLQ